MDPSTLRKLLNSWQALRVRSRQENKAFDGASDPKNLGNAWVILYLERIFTCSAAGSVASSLTVVLIAEQWYFPSSPIWRRNSWPQNRRRTLICALVHFRECWSLRAAKTCNLLYGVPRVPSQSPATGNVISDKAHDPLHTGVSVQIRELGEDSIRWKPDDEPSNSCSIPFPSHSWFMPNLLWAPVLLE